MVKLWQIDGRLPNSLMFSPPMFCAIRYNPKAFCSIWLMLTAGANPFSFKNFVAARNANENDTSDVTKVMLLWLIPSIGILNTLHRSSICLD